MSNILAATCKICGSMKLSAAIVVDPDGDFHICRECMKVREDYQFLEASIVQEPKKIYTR